MLERELIIKALVWKYMISESSARRMYDETISTGSDNLRKLAESYKASARMYRLFLRGAPCFNHQLILSSALQ